LLNF